MDDSSSLYGCKYCAQSQTCLAPLVLIIFHTFKGVCGKILLYPIYIDPLLILQRLLILKLSYTCIYNTCICICICI